MKLLLAFLLALGIASARANFLDPAANLSALPGVPPEFEVTLFAGEPLVRNPCSIAFDARGRMFVSMGPQYRNPTPETPPDSVFLVRDTDGDGVADEAQPFATGFNCVQGLAWHGNDLWVANAPDLTVARDLDGDDVADEYVRVFTDLGNIEHGLHGLNWAPDGRLYMSKGNSKGVVVADWKADEPDRIAPRPFRELWGVPGPADAPDFPPPVTFTKDTYTSTYQDPRDDWGRMGGILRCGDMGANVEIVARGFRNPYGLGFDHGFDWLGTDQDQNEGDRLFMPFFGADFGWSHAWSPHWTGENHPPTVPVSAPVFQGSGTGVLFADSPTWPARYRGVWIVNDWLLKSTHFFRPAWDGALLRPEGGKWETLVDGRDALYRPVDIAFGPDGALYVVGWGRGYGVERDKDGAMTNEGRIYRIAPREAPALAPPPNVAWAAMDVGQLVAEFAGVLPARRIAAQDELAGRGEAARAELAAILRSGTLDRGQETWALWALARAGADDAHFAELAAAGDTPLNARVQALRILGHRKSPALAAVVPSALGSAEARVRFAAVQAAHQAEERALVPALIDHASGETDRVTAFATWRALRDLADADALAALLGDTRPGVRRAALLALLDLGKLRPDALDRLSRDPDESVRAIALLGLGKAPPTPAPPSGGADSSLVANLAAESRRPYAAGVLRAGEPSYTDRPYVFRQVPALLDGAPLIRTANEDDGSRGQAFLTFDLALDASVIVAHDERIKARPDWLRAFADTDLTVATDDTTFRLWSKDFAAGPVTLGGNLAGPPSGAKSHYFVVLQPKPLPPRAVPTTEAEALAALDGSDPRRGEALYFHSAACATCHRVGERGTNFGPDLTSLGDRMDARTLVQSMLDPSAVITEGFAAHAVEAAGKSYFGILLSTGRNLRLGLAGGETVEIPAESITRHETLPVSPMPTQSVVLGPRDVADLAAWLLARKTETATVTEAFVAAGAANAAGAGLGVVEKADRLLLTRDGAPLGEFVFADVTVRRPFFANLRTPGGIQVTRAFPPVEGRDPTDHADMHPGLWLAFGDINGTDFWRNKGRIEHLRFREAPTVRDGRLTFATDSRLLTAENAPLCSLTSRFSLIEVPHGWMLVWDAEFHADQGDLVFGDQEEMGFGARVATALAESNGGAIRSSAGLATAAKTWGQPAAWCDYSGLIDGQPCGLTLAASTANFRPSWWHNRDYGVFVANPFGRAAMRQGEPSAVTVKAGDALRLRFSAVAHAGAGHDPAALFPHKDLPLPGEVFSLGGHTAFLIEGTTDPDAADKPWVWYAPTLPGLPGAEEHWMFDLFRTAGIAVAGIDAGESYGSPDGGRIFSALHAEMSGRRGYSPKPVLLGRSRGGLMTLSWAAAHPDKVGAFAGIYPVCNLTSYPGLDQAAGAYRMSPEALRQSLADHNPVDRLVPLASAGVPLFAIHGDSDTVVPLEANSGLARDRYTTLGGNFQLLVPPGQGHNMWNGFFQCQELVDFVKVHARR